MVLTKKNPVSVVSGNSETLETVGGYNSDDLMIFLRVGFLMLTTVDQTCVMCVETATCSLHLKL